LVQEEKARMKTIILYYLPVVMWCGFIFLLSSQPNLPGPGDAALDFIFKKSAHMFVYGILYWLLFRAVNVGKTKRMFLLPLCICIIYAATDEFHQSFIPGRTPTIRDVGFDTLGMTVSLLRLKKLI
jgi:VanZ family protein